MPPTWCVLLGCWARRGAGARETCGGAWVAVQASGRRVSVENLVERAWRRGKRAGRKEKGREICCTWGAAAEDARQGDTLRRPGPARCSRQLHGVKYGSGRGWLRQRRAISQTVPPPASGCCRHPGGARPPVMSWMFAGQGREAELQQAGPCRMMQRESREAACGASSATVPAGESGGQR